MEITLTVNGKAVAIDADDPQMPLLYALRDNLGLHGPRFGCGLGQCGACTVHIDGTAVRSCVTPIDTVTDKQKVVTLEGLGSSYRAAGSLGERFGPGHHDGVSGTYHWHWVTGCTCMRYEGPLRAIP